MPPLSIPQAAPAASVTPARSIPQGRLVVKSLLSHWPEYLCETVGLAFFMFSACSFALLLEHPESAVRQAVASADLRRLLMGIAMASTALVIIYSPVGRRSGAHINPAVTLGFLRLRRVMTKDAIFYIAAQFAGGLLGVALAAVVYGNALMHPAIRYAATVPGPQGLVVAFVAEFVISLVLFTAVLSASASPRVEKFTGVIAACLVAAFITFEAPLSGMSMNPARSFGSNFFADAWVGFWIYLIAPVLAMQLAAGLRNFGRRKPLGCAKFRHDPVYRCIFCGHEGAH